MTTPNKIKISETRLTAARRIDEIAGSAVELFKESGSFEAELSVAQAMSDLRLALTDDMMKPVMDLMNSDLGFRTDKDPATFDKNGQPNKPYPVAVVRECFIESKLRGFHTVGNEFNIIGGRFYAAKNGLRRKVTTYPGITDFKDTRDVPRTVGDKGAIVKCRATWKKDGVADSLEAEIPIRVNSFMGADAILGKAERKLLKLVYDRLSGVITQDGDATEGPTIEVPSEKTAPTFTKEIPPPTTIQLKLMSAMVDAFVTFGDLCAWLQDEGVVSDSDAFTTFEEIPDHLATRLYGMRETLIKTIKAKGK